MPTTKSLGSVITDHPQYRVWLYLTPSKHCAQAFLITSHSNHTKLVVDNLLCNELSSVDIGYDHLVV